MTLLRRISDLRRPRLVVLDEATSALPLPAERMVYEQLLDEEWGELAQLETIFLLGNKWETRVDKDMICNDKEQIVLNIAQQILDEVLCR